MVEFLLSISCSHVYVPRCCFLFSHTDVKLLSIFVIVSSIKLHNYQHAVKGVMIFLLNTKEKCLSITTLTLNVSVLLNIDYNRVVNFYFLRRSISWTNLHGSAYHTSLGVY